MPDIVLTVAEQDVLRTCRWDYQAVYLELRRRMDFGTGIVGMMTTISIQALREWTECHVERGRGSQVEQMSVRAVRSALECLCRRGLLTRKRTEHLVFLLPLARFASSRPNQTRQEPDTVKGAIRDTVYPHVDNSIFANDSAGFCGDDEGSVCAEPDKNPTGQNRTNPTNICVQRNTSTQQTTSTTCNGGGSGGGRGVVASGLAMQWNAQDERFGLSVEQYGLWQWLLKRGVRVAHDSVRLRRLMSDGVPHECVMRAVEQAREQRAGQGSSQPINIGLVDCIARELAMRSGGQALPWWAVDARLCETARDVGVVREAGETHEAFVGRVRDAVARRREAMDAQVRRRDEAVMAAARAAAPLRVVGGSDDVAR